MKAVIFTDLDGTLLSASDYSFERATPALDRVRKKGIPLVFSSSKTRKEIEAIRRKTSNRHPFISENGGGVFIPEGYFPFEVGERGAEGYRTITLGRPYEEVRSAFIEVRAILGIPVKGFGDMTADEVAKITGLALEEAELARERDFDEPFIFEDGKDAERKIAGLIEEKGFSVTRGRLYHMLGRHDKGKAVRLLKGYYRRLFGDFKTICLGDGENDIPLLKEADYPVLVKKEDGSYEKTSLDVIKADFSGPEGWNSSVNRILDEIKD